MKQEAGVFCLLLLSFKNIRKVNKLHTHTYFIIDYWNMFIYEQQNIHNNTCIDNTQYVRRIFNINYHIFLYCLLLLLFWRTFLYFYKLIYFYWHIWSFFSSVFFSVMIKVHCALLNQNDLNISTTNLRIPPCDVVVL